MADEQTLAVYARRADDYAKRFASEGGNPHLSAFLSQVVPGGRILDLGCGPGNAAAEMERAGFRVEAWDASPEMADIAQDANGIEVRVAAFDELTDSARFDGIYANFSLLHVPKAEMPGHLCRISRALVPGGFFHIGMKTGTGETRDTIGRFYAYYADDELTGLLADAGLTVLSRATGREKGLDGVEAPWIIMRAKRDD